MKDKDIDKVFEWIGKEVSIQPTDRGILHLKSQIISYIIPLAKEKLSESSPNTHQKEENIDENRKR